MPGVEPAPVLARHPNMSQVTRMAFGFIGETIRRDTEKWREKQERYTQAALRRGEKKRDGEKEKKDIWDYVRELHK